MPKTKKIRSKESVFSFDWGIAHSCRSDVARDMVTSMEKFDRKFFSKFQNFKFIEKSIFGLLIIPLATFDLQERTTTQIKAKNISVEVVSFFLFQTLSSY